MADKKQTFDWMSVSRRVDGSAAFRAQFEQSIRERARLLFHLKFSAADATRRISEALRWEFDASVWPKAPPAFLADIPRHVTEVYAQLTPGKAPA